MMLRVRKRPGMEKEDVLKADHEEEEDDDHDYDEDDGGMWGMMFGSDKKKDKKKAVKAAAASPVPSAESSAPVDVINVFTIASGHMYERLQKIMFLSVVKNTKRSVRSCVCVCVCTGELKGSLL